MKPAPQGSGFARRSERSGRQEGFSESHARPDTRALITGFVLLLGPAVIAVGLANALAGRLSGPLSDLLAPLMDSISADFPPFPEALLAGPYGLIAMFPFLVLYAGPTAVVFALLTALYKSTGLMDRIAARTHTRLRPFGIGGQDLVRVVMGFGCNVPAVTATRSCSGCSQGACISAISFGSACSYQLPATLAVFAAAGFSWLIVPYLVLLALGTLLYLRCTTPAALRQARIHPSPPRGNKLHKPCWSTMGREVWETLSQFMTLALPVFTVICLLAAALDFLGALDRLAVWLAPIMALFNLPGEAAHSVVFGSIRKDGLAIALLDSRWNAVKIPLENAVQVLTAVFLAGVLLPCVVTVAAIVRETHWRFAIKLCLRQMAAAVLLSLAIAWFGALWLRLF